MSETKSRRAAIDMGTNSFLLTVAEVVGGEILEVLEDHMIVVRLGQGVAEAGVLAEEAMVRGIDALRDFRARCDHWGIAPEAVRTAGTSALREAANRDEFAARALAETGFQVRVIPGQEEALLSFRGALSSLAPGDAGEMTAPCLLDIGGGSTELVWANGSERYSMPLGVVRARERHLVSDPPTTAECEALVDEVKAQLEALPSLPSPAPLIAVAGTPTTLVAIAEEIDISKGYDGSLIHGKSLDIATIQALTARLCAMDLEDRKGVTGLHPQRADLIIGGALILSTVLVILAQTAVLVSDRGLRYGLLLSDEGVPGSGTDGSSNSVI